MHWHAGGLGCGPGPERCDMVQRQGGWLALLTQLRTCGHWLASSLGCP